MPFFGIAEDMAEVDGENEGMKKVKRESSCKVSAQGKQDPEPAVVSDQSAQTQNDRRSIKSQR